jgi:hypothetical protein
MIRLRTLIHRILWFVSFVNTRTTLRTTTGLIMINAMTAALIKTQLCKIYCLKGILNFCLTVAVKFFVTALKNLSQIAFF